jgi:Na+/alanine symporter
MGNFIRLLGLACLVVGIVTAAMSRGFGGFTSIVWFLIAMLCTVAVDRTEVALARGFRESKEENWENNIVRMI